MPELFSPQAFAGFGPDRLHLVEEGPRLTRIESGRPSGLRSRVRLDCPRRPGVYGMVDARGELIYVGKARCLRSRLLSYFRPRSREPKAGAIIRETRLLVWEVVPTELSALLRELELIRRWQPRFNVQNQPRRKRPAWVCLGRRPAPHVFLTRRVPGTAQVAFGPVPGGATAREAVRRLNDWSRLRDCPQPQTMRFVDQQELFPVVRAAGCLRHEIGTCLAPCAAACSHTDYLRQVRAARAFLDGTDITPLRQMQQEMKAAAEALQFERAGALRDRLEILGWLHAHLERLRQARALSFVYPLQGYDGREWWYLVRCGQVRAILPTPGPGLAEVLNVVYGGRGAEQVDGVLLVAAWFRKRPAERQRCLDVEKALKLARQWL